MLVPISVLRQAIQKLVLWAATGKLECWVHSPALLISWEKLGPEVFHLLSLCWSRGETVVSVNVLVQTIVFVLSGLQAFKVCQVLSVLQNRQDKSWCLGQPSEKLVC